MRCPKCGYISFDYNQECPKCNKNIADEQAKLNLPSFRPTPPSLLGILTGEGDESNVGMHADSSGSMGDSHEIDTRLDDSVVLSTSEMDLDEGHEMEDVSIDHEDSGDFELSGGEDISVIDSDETPVVDTESLGMSLDEEEGGDLSLDLGDISLDEAEAEGGSVAEDILTEEGEQEISLDELSTVGSDISEEISGEETAAGPDSIDLGLDKEAGGEEGSEMELNLDDLKINETGELEIGKDIKPDKLTGDESLDLGDLSLDDSGPVAEDTMDLGDLPLEESGADDGEEAKAYDETLSIDESGLEAMIAESPSDISLDLSEEHGSAGTTDNEMSLDLENLDLDLDLDEPEDKS
jgi:hypothetical protein